MAKIKAPGLPAVLFFLLVVSASVVAAPISPTECQRLIRVADTIRGHIKQLEKQLKPSTELVRYEKAFTAGIPTGAPKPVSLSAFAGMLKQSRVVLLGDEHATTESQTNTLEVLKFMSVGSRPLVLVIEWIDFSQQKLVDRFLAGEIPLEEMRKKIRFDQDWGFSWNSYRRILAAAKKLKVSILLTERLKAKPGLSERDSLIAGDVVRYAKKNPAARFLIVYGEYHILGANHLAARLAKAGLKPDMKITGEAESVYWKILQQTLDPETVQAAALSGGVFFLRSGTPLERLVANRKYLMKLTETRAGDFPDWVPDRDAVPVLKSQERFHELHSVPGR
jgi:hypothetical protein